MLSSYLFSQEKTYIHKSDKSVQEISVSSIENFTVSTDGTQLNILNTDNSTQNIPISEIDSITFVAPDNEYLPTYEKTNELTDLLDGCRTINWVLPGAGTDLGMFYLQSGGAIAKSQGNKFGNGYSFKKDTPFLDYQPENSYARVFQFVPASDVVGNNVVKYVVGFWIDRTQLKGMPLQLTSYSGGTWDLYQDNLQTKGFVAYQRGVGSQGYDQVEVTAVDGDFSHITIRSDKSKSSPQLFNVIIEHNTEDLNEITIYNPTLLYEEQTVDPYHVYESESQRNSSPIRGKTILVMGDSQLGDATLSHGLARKLGVNIQQAAMGGHKMGYQDVPPLGIFAGWMYHWESRKLTLSVGADYYLMMISSNDGEGGGDSSTIETNAVLDNYPVYGDNQATIDAKMALFNAFSEDQKKEIFAYKQTYSAFIKQINTLYPESKVLLVTIPISDYEATDNGEWLPGKNADTQREANQERFLSIRKDIFELSEKHSTGVCDLYLLGGITWENFPTKVSGLDSVHWTVEAKQQFIAPVINTILNMSK